MNGEGIDIYGIGKKRDYYQESKRLRSRVMELANKLIGHPKLFTITKGIKMDVEITKSDLKTIVSKNTADNKFNAIKNAMAMDIAGYLRKSKYVGWRNVIDGKHPETAFFAYYNRSLGANSYLCMRKIKNTGKFKPYAIIDQKTFDAEIKNVHKTKPPK